MRSTSPVRKVSSRARRGYRLFHGKEPQDIGQVKFIAPETFIYLGDAVEIVYRCNKKNGGGDGRMAEYVHKCGKGNILCTDENRKNLYIFGPNQRIQDAGIVG